MPRLLCLPCDFRIGSTIALALLLPLCLPLPVEGQTEWNRHVEELYVVPSAPGATTFDLYAQWTGETYTDATVPRDLSVMADWLVNGTVIATTSHTAISTYSIACQVAGGPCNFDLCGSWNTGAGIDVEAFCRADATGGCTCGALFIAAGPPGVPLQPADEIMVILYPAPGALPEGDTSDDLSIQLFAGPAPLPNRSVESLTLTPSGPGLHDVTVEWVAEVGSSPLSRDVSTLVELQVNGTAVASVAQPAISLGASSCGPPCSSSFCGNWDADGVNVDGFCRTSPAQSSCTCGALFITNFPDVPAGSGDKVVVILRPAPGALPESLPEDDFEITTVDPEWNRRIVHLGVLPSSAGPGLFDLHVYWGADTLETTASRDLSACIDWLVNGVPVVTTTETAIANGAAACDLPGGGCLPTSCGTWSTGGAGEQVDGYCRNLGPSGECTCGIVRAAPGPSAVPLQPGDEIVVILRPAPGALPEPASPDDLLILPFQGPVPVPNRSVVPGSLIVTPAAPGLVDVTLEWLAESGAGSSESQDVSTIVEVRVGGTPVATLTQTAVAGPLIACGPPCDTDVCGTWDGGGIDLDGFCGASPSQDTCTCGALFITNIPSVPAQPGDELTIILRPAPGALPELPGFDDDEEEEMVPGDDPRFVRGDADGDSLFNGLVDAVFCLTFQFVPGSPAPPCLDSADFDDDGIFNGLIDALGILGFQFGGGAPPAPPYPECGEDPSADALGCDMPPCP